MALKDRNWQQIVVAAAGELSNTFGSSSPGTDNYISADGAIGIKIKATSIALGALSAIRVTPKFKDADSNVTYAAQANGDPAYCDIKATERETPVFWDIDGVEVGCEVWLSASDANAAITIEIKRVYPKD